MDRTVLHSHITGRDTQSGTVLRVVVQDRHVIQENRSSHDQNTAARAGGIAAPDIRVLYGERSVKHAKNTGTCTCLSLADDAASVSVDRHFAF